MYFPTWIDLKGQDSVPETVHHCVSSMSWAVTSEKMPLNMCKMHRLRSTCADTKCHTGFYTPFIHSVVSNDSVNRQMKALIRLHICAV